MSIPHTGPARLLARAPNHLGDGVMALPALHALSSICDELVIQAPGWGPVLYRDVRAKIEARGPVQRGRFGAAVLFSPSFRVAWQARRVPRRVGVAADGRVWLLTDVVPPRRHRMQTYAALAEALGAKAGGEPRFPVRNADPSVDVPAGHVGLNPVSPSGQTVMWPHFAELSRRLSRPLVAYGGPGEQARVAAQLPGVAQRVGLPLPAFARALQRCALFISNDSGAAHFARAVGVPVLVIHGSTTSTRTGAAGAVAVEGPELDCRPCYRKSCPVPDIPCLSTPVEVVLAAAQRALEGR